MHVSYLPFYRAYRPQSLPELVGQSVVAKILTNAIALNKISHAYLFTGPRGTGKTSTARMFAKSLNCIQGPTVTPCQTCDSCLNITQGIDVDVLEFDAASNGGVGDARKLVESSQFAPIAGRFKIYIVDEVHMLSKDAFNALLKTLEEPPANVIFIFATTEAQKVLPTIVSRCQSLHFNRIATPDIQARLQWVCDQEGLAIQPDALRYLARQARGGLRDALSSLDQLAVLARGQETALTLEDTVRFLGQIEDGTSVTLLEHLFTQNSEALLALLMQLETQGIEATLILPPLQHGLRHLLLAKASKGHPLTGDVLETSEEVAQRIQILSQTVTMPHINRVIQGLYRLESELRRSAEPGLTLETGLLALSLSDGDASIEPLLERIAALEARVEALLSQSSGGAAPHLPTVSPSMMLPPMPLPLSAPPGMPPPLSVTPAAPALLPPALDTPILPPAPASLPVVSSSSVAPVASSVEDTSLVALHQRIVAHLPNASFKGMFARATLVRVQEDTLTLKPNAATFYTSLQEPRRIKAYREAASAVLNKPITVTLEPAGATTTPPPSPSVGAVASTSVPSGVPSLQFVATSLPPSVAEPAPASVPTLTPIPPALIIDTSTPVSVGQAPSSVETPAVPSLPPETLEDMASIAFDTPLPAPTLPPPLPMPDSPLPTPGIVPDVQPSPLTMPPALPMPPALTSPTLDATEQEEPSVDAISGIGKPLHIHGKGDDWDAAQSYVKQLLKASDLDVVPDVEAEDPLLNTPTPPEDATEEEGN
jgi:DNA polymerase III subunit gamma/tau